MAGEAVELKGSRLATVRLTSAVAASIGAPWLVPLGEVGPRRREQKRARVGPWPPKGASRREGDLATGEAPTELGP